MKYIDPKLGVELPERDYAAHCELYTPNDPTSYFRNLYDTVNDEFIWAHLIGWWGKTMLIRDAGLCWILSILFEFWEMTFEHMLPNFKECWWDHIILDILVCNGLGIYLGLLTCRALQMKEYDWTGLWRYTTRTQTISTANATTTTTTSTTTSTTDSSSPLWKRALAQLTPQTYDAFHWDILQSPKRLFAVMVMILIISLVELNAFWLKYLLWIPPPHPINIWRLLMWSALGLPGLREYYQFVTDPTNKKFGTSAWLCCAIAGMETLIEIKFGRGQFPTPAPASVYIPWAVFTVLFIGGFTIYFATKSRRESAGASASAAAVQKKKK
jgi:phosphatidylserine synthase 2